MLSYPIFEKVLYPAYISLNYDCKLQTVEDLEAQGYYAIGTFTANPDDTTSIEIKIPANYSNSNNTSNSKLFDKTLIHEQCHEKQWQENRFYGCGDKFWVFVNEIECYLVSESSPIA